MEIASLPALQNFRNTNLNTIIIFRDGTVPDSLEGLPFDYNNYIDMLRDSQTVSTIGAVSKKVNLLNRGFIKGSYQVKTNELPNNAFGGKYVRPFTVTNAYGLRNKTSITAVQGLCGYIPLRGAGLPNSVQLPNTESWLECELLEPAVITGFTVSCAAIGNVVNYMDVEILNMDGNWVRPLDEGGNMANGNMRMYGNYGDFGDGWRIVKGFKSTGSGYGIFCNEIRTPSMIKGMRFRGKTSAGFLNSVSMFSDDAPAEVSHSANITHAILLPYGSNDEVINSLSPMLMSVGTTDENDLVISNQGYNPVLDTPDIDYDKMGLTLRHIQ